MAKGSYQTRFFAKSLGQRLVGNLKSSSSAVYEKGIQHSKLKTLRNDALIARLAVTHNGFVVTHDVDDFELIRKVMPDLHVVPANEFFEV